MDSKDFKRYIADQLKSYLFSKHNSYSAKQRQSRPRAKENIINPKMKGI